MHLYKRELKVIFGLSGLLMSSAKFLPDNLYYLHAAVAKTIKFKSRKDALEQIIKTAKWPEISEWCAINDHVKH